MKPNINEIKASLSQKGVVAKSMEPKNRKLKYAIIVLIILFVISASALAGTLIYNHLAHTEPTTVDVPGNIITPDGENSTDTKSDTSKGDPSADPQPSDSSTPDSTISNTSSPSETTEAPSVSSTKASALSLHTKQPEENKPFQVTNMFPGDAETKYYRIKVSYKGDIIVRYHADIHSEYEQLAEVLKVKIRLLASDGILYDGLLRDMVGGGACCVHDDLHNSVGQPELDSAETWMLRAAHILRLYALKIQPLRPPATMQVLL